MNVNVDEIVYVHCHQQGILTIVVLDMFLVKYIGANSDLGGLKP